MKFRSTRFRRLMVLVTMVFSVGLEGRGAEESVKSPAVAAALPQVDVELRGVFEGVLPGTEEKNHLSLFARIERRVGFRSDGAVGVSRDHEVSPGMVTLRRLGDGGPDSLLPSLGSSAS